MAGYTRREKSIEENREHTVRGVQEKMKRLRDEGELRTEGLIE